jgi:hypothetical protein
MADVNDVKTSIDKALDRASRCAADETSENYEVLEDFIEEIEGQSREAFESKMDVASLLPKLKNAKPLQPADLKTLELLIVGDAEYYLKYEPDLNTWRREAKRIIAEIAGLKSTELDVDGLMHLRALCREARRVLPDLVFYFDQKERAARFAAATKGPIDQEGYRALTEIVEGMIGSDKV